MKRALMFAAATTLAFGCGEIGNLDNSQEALAKCDSGECLDAGNADGGGSDGCDGDEADAGLLCGPCGPRGECLDGVCIGGICRDLSDGGMGDAGHGDGGIIEPDGGIADGGGFDGCDGDEADAGLLCGPCGPRGECLDSVCIGGVCRDLSDGGRPDAG
jgi:hypothetical protein